MNSPENDGDDIPKIAIYGATGFTGRLVAECIAGGGRPLRLGGRNEGRLQKLAADLEERFQVTADYRVAAADDGDELDVFLEGMEVLINCAGPFVDIGKPVVDGAIRKGVHYLDTTGEQDHIRWIAEQRDAAAREREVLLMPACAFEFALGDLGARLAVEKGAKDLVIAYAVEGARMSHGTKKSLVRSLASPGVAYEEGQYVEERTGARRFDVPLPDGSTGKGLSVAGGEAITLPRGTDVNTVHTCVVSDSGLASLAAASIGALSPLISALRPVADRLVELTSGNPHRKQVTPPHFSVIFFDPDSAECHLSLSGRDMYQTTAEIIGEAARRIVDNPPEQVGFAGPGDVFEPIDFLAAAGVRVASEPLHL